MSPVERPSHEQSPAPYARYAAVRRYEPALTFSPDGADIAYVTNTSGQFKNWRTQCHQRAW